MTFREYQKAALESAIYPNKGQNIFYPALGLCGESGEIAEKVKKVFRDQGGALTSDNRDALRKEIGDVLWYCAAMAYECDLNLDDIACLNIEKLSSRKERGVLSGSGDDR